MGGWHDWVEPASVVGGFATGLAAAGALVALVPGIIQILSGIRANREAGALQAHRDYLRLCFDNPEYSSTALFKQAHPEVYLATIEQALTPVTEKYLWFVSVLLNTCEQLILFVSSKAEWRAVAVSQLSYHADVLRVVWPSWRTHYSAEMDVLVREATDEGDTARGAEQ